MNRIKLYYQAIFITLISLIIYIPVNAQLKIGTSKSEINLRQGPGPEFKVLETISSSNLLVILPQEPINGFVETFDVESNSRGYVFEKLIQVTDTLKYSNQHFFEKAGESANGDIEIDIINGTSHPLFVWINSFSYNVDPHEKKILIMENEEILYFSSSPGLFPVFGKEVLMKGNKYMWKFSL